MKVFSKAQEIRAFLLDRKKPVAFVPTLGALHEGHLALIDAANSIGKTTVASIFVNPTQFNDPADYEGYPRTPAADADLLRSNACHALFRPPPEEIYPENLTDPTTKLDFGRLVQVMEGAKRPGHFAGVAQVVYRLLDTIRPDILVLGQKDYQQVAVIRSMVAQLKIKVRLHVVPTVRDEDGLALSSRNRRLNAPQRAAAAQINSHLKAVAAGLRAGWDPRDLEANAMREIARHELLRPEYVSVFDGLSLQPWQRGMLASEVVVATAVHCGPVRLIDNLIVNSTDTPKANP